MIEESTTPDVLELTRRLADALTERNVDVVLSFFSHDAVWDSSRSVIGTFEGRRAIRTFAEDWFGAYEDLKVGVEEIRDLGHGVTFCVVLQRGRFRGGAGWVESRYAAVSTWADGLIERIANYNDSDEARAAAERLAEERA